MSPLEVLGVFVVLYATSVIVICAVRIGLAHQSAVLAWPEDHRKQSKREWKLQVLTRILQSDCDKIKRIMNSR